MRPLFQAWEKCYFIKCAETNTESRKMKKQKTMFQTNKKQDKTPETKLNEIEVNDLPDKSSK